MTELASVEVPFLEDVPYVYLPYIGAAVSLACGCRMLHVYSYVISEAMRHGPATPRDRSLLFLNLKNPLNDARASVLLLCLLRSVCVATAPLWGFLSAPPGSPCGELFGGRRGRTCTVVGTLFAFSDAAITAAGLLLAAGVCWQRARSDWASWALLPVAMTVGAAWGLAAELADDGNTRNCLFAGAGAQAAFVHCASALLLTVLGLFSAVAMHRASNENRFATSAVMELGCVTPLSRGAEACFAAELPLLGLVSALLGASLMEVASPSTHRALGFAADVALVLSPIAYVFFWATGEGLFPAFLGRRLQPHLALWHGPSCSVAARDVTKVLDHTPEASTSRSAVQSQKSERDQTPAPLDAMTESRLGEAQALLAGPRYSSVSGYTEPE